MLGPVTAEQVFDRLVLHLQALQVDDAQILGAPFPDLILCQLQLRHGEWSVVEKDDCRWDRHPGEQAKKRRDPAPAESEGHDHPEHGRRHEADRGEECERMERRVRNRATSG